jgi:3-oxoadipate enol-lactonase
VNFPAPAPVRLNYKLSGQDGAPVLMLVASLGTTMGMWEPQLPRLEARFRVLRADTRGHGGSPVPPGPYSIGDIGGDLLTLLDSLGIAAVSYCGLSLGGMAGMWLAAHAPDRIDRLALCCTSAWLPPAEGWTSRAAQVRAHGTASIREQVTARWFTPGFRDANPAVVTWAGDMLAATPDEGYAGCCEAIAAMDLRPVLSKISAPTLVIAGSEDPATPPAAGEAIAAAVAGARLTLVHAAHLANVEAPAAVSDRLMTHLEHQEGT